MTTPLEAFGDFPPLLYKAFSEEIWARRFVEDGILRFSTLNYFADLGDPIRADKSEGESRNLIPGDVHSVKVDPDGNPLELSSSPGLINYSGSFAQPIYICCFSYPPNGDTSKLPFKFGRYVARIENPRRLAQDITNKLTADDVLRGTPVVECWPVVYNKDGVAEHVADHFERSRLHFTQKPPAYADEHEYRFAVVSTLERADKLGDHCIVTLGALPYVSLL